MIEKINAKTIKMATENPLCGEIGEEGTLAFSKMIFSGTIPALVIEYSALFSSKSV